MSLCLSQCCPCRPAQLCLDAAEAVYLLYAWASVPSLSSHHPAVGILAPLDIRDWLSGRQASPFQPSWHPGQTPTNAAKPLTHRLEQGEWVTEAHTGPVLPKPQDVPT